jgi:hypothetical protein
VRVLRVENDELGLLGIRHVAAIARAGMNRGEVAADGALGPEPSAQLGPHLLRVLAQPVGVVCAVRFTVTAVSNQYRAPSALR